MRNCGVGEMMIFNNANVEMSDVIYRKLEKAGNLIGDAFGKRVFSVTITPDRNIEGRLYGVAFAFDTREEKNVEYE